MLRRLLLLGTACVCACAVFAAPASAVKVGQSAQSTVTGTGCTTATGCDFVQFQDGDTNYSMPFDGVVTSYLIRSGTDAPTPADAATLRIYRIAGNDFTLIGESAAGAFMPFAGTDSYMPARISVRAGDRIGSYVHYAANIAWSYASGSLDAIGAINVHPGVGGTINGPTNITAFSSLRLNIQVNLEHDDDHDGYGDESQDLCPGDGAHGNSGCSGVTIGSTFLNPTSVGTNAGCGAPPCIYFNSQFGAQSTASPVGGVIVRWRMRSGISPPVNFKLRVLRPAGPNKATPIATSEAINEAGDGSDAPTLGASTRLPISVGDWIGLQSSSGQNYNVFQRPGAGLVSSMINAPADGTDAFALFGFNSDLDLLYNADVEPDVDGDGFGDVTQDLCPSDATLQTKCPAPQITGLKLSAEEVQGQKEGRGPQELAQDSGWQQCEIHADPRSAGSVRRHSKTQGQTQRQEVCEEDAQERAREVMHLPWRCFLQLQARARCRCADDSFLPDGSKKASARNLKPGNYVLTASPANATAGVGANAKTEFVIAK